MWSALLVAVYAIMIIMINAKELTYYIDFERPNLTYINPKYFEYANLTARRYSRRDPIHYVTMHFKTCLVFRNDMNVHLSVYEFLSNEYRHSMIDLNVGLCELFASSKLNVFFPFYVKYFNDSSCPFPKGEYHFVNMSVAYSPILATFPFRKGRLFMNFKRNGELVGDGYIDTAIKEKFI